MRVEANTKSKSACLTLLKCYPVLMAPPPTENGPMLYSLRRAERTALTALRILMLLCAAIVLYRGANSGAKAVGSNIIAKADSSS